MDEAEIDINKQKTEVWYYILNYSLDVFDLNQSDYLDFYLPEARSKTSNFFPER